MLGNCARKSRTNPFLSTDFPCTKNILLFNQENVAFHLNYQERNKMIFQLNADHLDILLKKEEFRLFIKPFLSIHVTLRLISNFTVSKETHGKWSRQQRLAVFLYWYSSFFLLHEAMEGKFCELSKERDAGWQETMIQLGESIVSILLHNLDISAQAGLVTLQYETRLRKRLSIINSGNANDLRSQSTHL